jgi:hypothetical protein
MYEPEKGLVLSKSSESIDSNSEFDLSLIVSIIEGVIKYKRNTNTATATISTIDRLICY